MQHSNDFAPRYRVVRPAPPEVIRQAEEADLDAWLNRPRPFRDLIADLRDNADLAVFCVTFGIIIGCLGTVLAAFAWSAAS